MLTSGLYFLRSPFLLFFFAVSVQGFFALALSLISFYLSVHTLRDLEYSFLLCPTFLQYVQNLSMACWFIGSGQWKSVSVTAWPTSLANNGLLLHLLHSNFLSFDFDHIYCDHYYSLVHPFMHSSALAALIASCRLEYFCDRTTSLISSRSPSSKFSKVWSSIVSKMIRFYSSAHLYFLVSRSMTRIAT